MLFLLYKLKLRSSKEQFTENGRIFALTTKSFNQTKLILL